MLNNNGSTNLDNEINNENIQQNNNLSNQMKNIQTNSPGK